MALKLGATFAIAAVSAALATIDAASSAANGRLEIYDGTEPADAVTEITDQVKLVEFDLPTPAFGAPSDDVAAVTASANSIAPVVATQAGTATWFRLTDGDGTVLLQGNVADDNTGDINISSTSIVSGVEVSVVSLSYVQPKQ